jgi:hypothetical protein
MKIRVAYSTSFGFDEKFTSFGARNVKFFNGERFVGFPINSSTHVRWQSNTTSFCVKGNGTTTTSMFFNIQQIIMIMIIVVETPTRQ